MTLISGTRRGDFCYHLDGRIGEVDDFLEDVPINVQCDPRLSCANSIAQSQCLKVQGMTSIMVNLKKNNSITSNNGHKLCHKPLFISIMIGLPAVWHSKNPSVLLPPRYSTFLTFSGPIRR